MSEQAAEQAEGLEDQSTEGLNSQEDQQEEQQPAKTTEDLAREMGWKPEDEWHGDKSKWIKPDVYIERAEWTQRYKSSQKRMDEMESKFNIRLDNANKLHQQQMEIQRDELIRKRDDAIDNADRESANAFQGQIDKINANHAEPTVNNGQSTLDSWNQSNPWILQNTPKAGYAKQQFGFYQSKGMDADQAIKSMENDVNREFPDVNTARDNYPMPERGTPPGKKRATRKLTMSDITSEERRYYQAMPGAWKSEADFLQAVQDTRGEK